MRFLVAACSLGLCLLASISPASATIFTITVSGDLTSGYETDNLFGLGTNTDLTGDAAVFAYVINTSLLGAAEDTSPGQATWIYSDVPTFAGDSPQCPPCSAVSIGITDLVTINGVTLTTGLDRQILDLEYGNLSSPGENIFEVSGDNKNEPDDLYNLRDLVALTIITENYNTFFGSLDPNNIGGLTLPSCNTDNGDSSVAQFRSDATQDNGYIDLCSAEVSYSVTATPEPMTIALFGAGLLGLGALRRRKTMRV